MVKFLCSFNLIVMAIGEISGKISSKSPALRDLWRAAGDG